MPNKLKRTVLSLAASFILFMPILAPVAVSAAATTTTPVSVRNSLCQGTEKLTIDSSGAYTCSTTDQTTGFNDTLHRIINIFSVIVGVVAVIMIIVGGFRYITSGGSSDKITSAKNTLVYALIGLVIVALAQIIVKFVLTNTPT